MATKPAPLHPHMHENPSGTKRIISTTESQCLPYPSPSPPPALRRSVFTYYPWNHRLQKNKTTRPNYCCTALRAPAPFERAQSVSEPSDENCTPPPKKIPGLSRPRVGKTKLPTKSNANSCHTPEAVEKAFSPLTCLFPPTPSKTPRARGNRKGGGHSTRLPKLSTTWFYLNGVTSASVHSKRANKKHPHNDEYFTSSQKHTHT